MNGEKTTIYHRLNPLTAVYTPMISAAEPTLDEEPNGKYGAMWMQWMEEYYPEKVDWMLLGRSISLEQTVTYVSVRHSYLEDKGLLTIS